MNKNIKPTTLILVGIVVFIITAFANSTQNNTYGVTPLSFVASMLMLVAVAIFLFGIVGLFTRGKKHDEEA